MWNVIKHMYLSKYIKMLKELLTFVNDETKRKKKSP